MSTAAPATSTTNAPGELSRRIRDAMAAIAPSEKRILAIVLALLCWKNALYVLGVHFDSDQALLGLVGVKLSHWQGLTVFVYGQRYLFALESWLAAPLFALFGPSITALKLPLFVMQLVVGAVFCRAAFQARLSRPAVLLALSPFLVTTPWMSMSLVAAHGCNPEPFLATALAWVLRRRPFVLGLVSGLLYMVRPFAAYALVALVLLDVLFCRKPFAKRTREWIVTGIGFLLVAGVLTYLAPKGTDFGGPPSPNLKWNPQWKEDLELTFQTHVLSACGLSPGPIGYPPLSLKGDALDWLTTLVKWTMAFVIGRVLWGLLRDWRGRWEKYSFGLYLTAIGLMAWAPMIFLKGMTKDVWAVRYVFLVILALIGLLVLFFQVERSAWVRRGVGAALALKAAVHFGVMASIQFTYAKGPTPNVFMANDYRALADYLVEHDITSGIAPYWVSYHVSFLTKERVKLTESDRYAISEYKQLYDRKLPNSVDIQERPCRGGVRVAAWYVCPRTQRAGGLWGH